MSWLSIIWKKESTKVILKSALAILKIFAGETAELLWKRTTDLVQKAEDMPLTGPQKAKYVADNLRAQWGDIKTHLINLLTELAVAWLREGLLKR